MHALPPAPAPSPRRQLFIGTTIACAAGALLYGAMLAVYLAFRQTTLASPDGVWRPEDAIVPEVATNIMLLTFVAIGVFVQWSVYAARRQHTSYVGVSLGLVILLALAVINGQAFAYFQMDLGVADGTYQTLFYGLTGTFVALVIAGMVFSAVTVVRFLGGRTRDTELVTANAIYWYFVSAVYTALWFVVYVTK